MKTRNELANDYIERLYVSGEVHELNVARTAFMAGYRAAMNELARLSIPDAVVVIAREAHEADKR